MIMSSMKLHILKPEVSPPRILHSNKFHNILTLVDIRLFTGKLKRLVMKASLNDRRRSEVLLKDLFALAITKRTILTQGSIAQCDLNGRGEEWVCGALCKWHTGRLSKNTLLWLRREGRQNRSRTQPALTRYPCLQTSHRTFIF